MKSEFESLDTDDDSSFNPESWKVLILKDMYSSEYKNINDSFTVPYHGSAINSNN